MTHSELVNVRAGALGMEGMLEIPLAPIGMVLFAHSSSSSSRHSPTAMASRTLAPAAT